MRTAVPQLPREEQIRQLRECADYWERQYELSGNSEHYILYSRMHMEWLFLTGNTTGATNDK